MYIDELPSMIVILLAIYGVYSIIRNVIIRLRNNAENSSDSEEEKLRKREENRRNIFNSLKIFFVGIIIAVILYMTPVINETIKIVVSLAVTLGTLGTAFLLNDEDNKKPWLRPVLFIGQMFFGITMFLMLVNTNMGYSEFSVFLIWSIFNFFIAKYFGNIENKILFAITTLITVVILISRYAVNIESSIIIGLLCVALLAIRIFCDKEKTGVKITHNVLITLLLLAHISYLSNHYGGIVLDDKVVLGITIVFLIATIVIECFANKIREVNFRGLAIYIPLLITIFLAGIKGSEEDFLFVFGILNLAVATWFLSNKSVYKKILASLILLLMTFTLIALTNLDSLNQIVILASMGLTFVFLLEPKKVKVVKEADKNEEE